MSVCMLMVCIMACLLVVCLFVALNGNGGGGLYKVNPYIILNEDGNTKTLKTETGGGGRFIRR